ncbi:MAG: hypothetical protein VYC17_06140 [Nitrospinota bacterium]|nr:hypothetical protein [Nitrospinota bacterium]
MRICLTIDIDWAPEDAILWIAERIRTAKVPATWFATHQSETLQALAQEPHHEIGLHPNFFPGSTHGQSMEEVMVHLASIYPGTRGVRAHGLLDSTRHQWHYRDLGMKYVSNIIKWNEPSEPFYLPWTDLWHFPISWEDDCACLSSQDDSIPEPLLAPEGSLWVVTFHPIYCYLNENPYLQAYAQVKSQCKDLSKASKSFLEPFRRKGDGLAHVFDSFLDQNDRGRFALLGGLYLERERERTGAA